MENTITTGSRLLGFRLSYTFADPKRGDIVVFKYPVAKAMTREERKALKQLALDKETTVSALLRQWLKEHMDQEKSEKD